MSQQIVPSTEQQEIINCIIDFNIKVNAVAGSAKTTTSLLVAKGHPDLNILLVTYSQRLKHETREKVKIWNMKNIEVHSFHSLGLKYFKGKCTTDGDLLKIIEEGKVPVKKRFDIIIIDEAQDMTDVYYNFMEYFLKTQSGYSLLIVGDEHQSIYQYNGASPLYLIESEKYFSNNKEWKSMKLQTSYRLSKPTANLLNQTFFGFEQIQSIKDGPDIDYYLCDFYRDASSIIRRYLDCYSFEDIFILSPVLNCSNKSPVKVIENQLALADIPLYYPTSDVCATEESKKGKIVFSSFHQSKGRERKLVFVLDFNLSKYEKEKDPTQIFNKYYVAASRSSEKLVLLHHYENNNLPFLRDNLISYTNPYILKELTIDRVKNLKTKNYPVTDLIRHIDQEVLQMVSEIKFVEIQKPQKFIDIPTTCQTSIGCEEVSDINGVAIPMYLEILIKGRSSVNEKLTVNNLTVGKVLYASAKHIAMENNLMSKLKQIDNYSWFPEFQMKKCVKRLQKHIDSEASFENFIFADIKHKRRQIKLMGYTDCENHQNIWEFKCCRSLQPEHILQLAVYSYIQHLINKNNNYNYYLFNILSGQILKLKPNYKLIQKIVKKILDLKLS